MMQSAEEGQFGNLPEDLNDSMDRRVLAQGRMRSHLIIVGGIALRHPTHVDFAEDHHVVDRTRAGLSRSSVQHRDSAKASGL